MKRAELFERCAADEFEKRLLEAFKNGELGHRLRAAKQSIPTVFDEYVGKDGRIGTVVRFKPHEDLGKLAAVKYVPDPKHRLAHHHIGVTVSGDETIVERTGCRTIVRHTKGEDTEANRAFMERHGWRPESAMSATEDRAVAEEKVRPIIEETGPTSRRRTSS